MYILLSMIVYFAGLYVLYLVIRAAIDNSKTAKDIRAIKNMLNKEYPEIVNDNTGKEAHEISSDEDFPDNKCQACYADITDEDKVCPSCGLKLIDGD